MANKAARPAVAGAKSKGANTRPQEPAATKPAANDEGGQADAIGGDTSLSVVTSLPDDIPRHNISDEQLDVLCDPSRDELWETKWAVLGLFFGALPGAADALWDYFQSADGALTVLDLTYIVATFVSGAVWFVLRFVVQRKTVKSLDMRDDIRARTRKIREAVSSGTHTQ